MAQHSDNGEYRHHQSQRDDEKSRIHLTRNPLGALRGAGLLNLSLPPPPPERRLRKLETRLTDRSRLVPRTQQWLDYWTVRLGKWRAGPVDEKMPVEFLDAVIARADPAPGGAPA
jgi:hypothetical protein